MSAPAIKVRGAVYRAGGRALVNGVDLDVWPGEILAVVGPNGAGKSTLRALIAGDLRPHAGEVEVGGQAVSRTSAPALARMRSLLPQHTPLNFPFTARDVALMGRHPYLRRWRAPTERAYAAADDALRRVGMLDMAERLYPTLSGGEQRRVSFARALAQDTPVALFDEPTASLDVGHQEMAMEERRRLAAEGRAVLAALHDLNLAGAHADRVAVMLGGEIVAVGETREALCGELLSAVFDRPPHRHPASADGQPRRAARRRVLSDERRRMERLAPRSASSNLSLWRPLHNSVAPSSSRFRGSDGALRRRGSVLRADWIPTYAGMTGSYAKVSSGRGRRAAAGEGSRAAAGAGCRPRGVTDPESAEAAVTQAARRT